jgi:tetratricopeptide (TPR) repeat protein
VGRDLPHSIGGYRVLGELGSGGMGVVFRAQAADGRLVALKVLTTTHDVAAERFSREAKALARVQHPGVIPLLDAGADEGRAFLVTEFVEGESLQALLDREGPMAPRVAARWSRDLAHALEAVHDAGLLHRDVKPANVLLDEDGRIRLADFGLVKLLGGSLEQLSRTGQMMGTPGFWAPEQARGRVRDMGPHTDAYGIGATLYALLTGEPPLTGSSLMELLDKGFQVDPPSALVPDLDPRLDAICLHALASAREDRYPSATALADDLDRYLANETVSQSAVQMLRQPGRLGRAQVALAVLGLLVAAGAGSLAALRARPEAAGTTAPAPSETASPTDPLATAAEASAPSPDPADRVIRSVADLDALLRDPPRDDAARALLHLERAWARLYADDAEGALADFTQALALDPADYEARVGRGMARGKLDDPEGAMGDFSQAIEQAPERPDAYRSRAGFYEAREDLGLAEADLTRAIELDPDHAATLRWRGRIRAKRDDWAAVEDLERVTQLTPDDPQVWLELANRYNHHAAYARALRAYDRVLELDPNRPEALARRGQVRLATGQRTLAVRDLTRSLEQKRLASTYLLRACAYQRLGRSERATEDADAAAALGYEHPDLYGVRGDAHLHAGRYREALAEFERALGVDARHSDSLELCARTHALLGETEAAVKRFRDVLRQNRNAYAAIWIALLGGDPEPLRRHGVEEGWPGPLLRYLRGKLSKRRLVQETHAPVDPVLARQRRCETFAILGLEAENAGDRARARHYYAAALAANVPRYFEHLWAGQRLAALGPPSLDETTPLPALQKQLDRRGQQDDSAGVLAITDHLIVRAAQAWKSWSNRAEALARLGRLDDALAAADQALALETRVDLLSLRARVRLLAGDREGALADVEAIVELDPEEPEWLLERSLRRAQQDRFDEALADAERVLELQPGRPKALQALATALEHVGRYAEAEAALSAAIDAQPGMERLWLGRARLRWHLREREGSLADLNAALEANPEYLYTPLWLAAFGGRTGPAQRLASRRQDWVGSLAKLVLGEDSLEAVLSQIDNVAVTDQAHAQERRCEAYGYAALLAERAGDLQRARELYQASVDTGVRHYVEFAWAARRLADELRPLAWPR